MYKIIALVLFLSCAGLMCNGCGDTNDSSSEDFTSNYLEAQAIHKCVHTCDSLQVEMNLDGQDWRDCYDACILEVCPNGIKPGAQLDREMMCN